MAVDISAFRRRCRAGNNATSAPFRNRRTVHLMPCWHSTVQSTQGLHCCPEDRMTVLRHSEAAVGSVLKSCSHAASAATYDTAPEEEHEMLSWQGLRALSPMYIPASHLQTPPPRALNLGGCGDPDQGDLLTPVKRMPGRIGSIYVALFCGVHFAVGCGSHMLAAARPGICSRRRMTMRSRLRGSLVLLGSSSADEKACQQDAAGAPQISPLPPWCSVKRTFINCDGEPCLQGIHKSLR